MSSQTPVDQRSPCTSITDLCHLNDLAGPIAGILQVKGLDGDWEVHSCTTHDAYVCERNELCLDGIGSLGTCGCCGIDESCGGAGDVTTCGEYTPAQGCRFATFGEHDYWFCDGASTWQDAQNRCEAIDSNLVTIESAPENAFVAENSVTPKWIGLHDASHNQQFIWADGSNVSFTNWQPGEPSHGSSGQPEDCALIHRPGLDPERWADVACGSSMLSNQPVGYVCEESRDVSDLGAAVEAGAVQLALLEQVQAAPDFDSSTAIRTAFQRDALAAQVARVMRLVPGDAELNPDSDMGPTISALGHALLASTVLQASGLGRHVDGVCDNILVAHRSATGTDSPLGSYYTRIAELENTIAKQDAVWELTRIQAGIRCLNTRDLTRLDSALTYAFIQMMRHLLDSGKSVAAHALWDRSLPVAMLLYDAVKSHRVPSAIWILRYPDNGVVPSPRFASLEAGLGFDAMSDFPAWENTLASRFYCAGDEINYSLGQLGVWAEDIIHGGSLNRVPLDLSDPIVIPRGPCGALRELTTLENLGAGDCSLLEMAFTGWRCKSRRTCMPLPPPEMLDPEAPPGSDNSPTTVLGTSRSSAASRSCGASALPFQPTRDCLSAIVDATNYLLAGESAGLFSCTLEAIEGATPIFFRSAYESARGCSNPFAEEGAEDPPASDDDEENDEDTNDVTDETRTKRGAAASRLRRMGKDLADAARNVGGKNGFQPDGAAKYEQATQDVADALREGEIPVKEADLPGETVGGCPPPCNLSDPEILIDPVRIEEIAFAKVQDAPATIGECRADAICSARLDSKISQETIDTLVHEAAHLVDGEARRDGAFTAAGERHLRWLDRNAKPKSCSPEKRKSCDSTHQIIYGGGAVNCAADMPCGDDTCLHPDSIEARTLDCFSSADPPFADPRCWYVDPCSEYQTIPSQCIARNVPVVSETCALVQCGSSTSQSLLGAAGCCSLATTGAVASPCLHLPPSCENSCCPDCLCPAEAYSDVVTEISCDCEANILD